MAHHGRIVVCIIPVLNEEQSITHVLHDMPACVDHVIVVDNGSTDATALRASDAGAIVVHEPRRGYGSACLKGLSEARSLRPDVIVFCDGDHSDVLDDMPSVLDPVCSGNADLCIGSRVRGEREQGSLLPQQVFGNWLATSLIRLFWKVDFSDLGPMRAVSTHALHQMSMEDPNYGWTVEMQIKAARLGLRCTEIPVRYRRRIGTSKIAGTVSGTFKAGTKILLTIARYAAD